MQRKLSNSNILLSSSFGEGDLGRGGWMGRGGWEGLGGWGGQEGITLKCACFSSILLCYFVLFFVSLLMLRFHFPTIYCSFHCFLLFTQDFRQ